MVVYSEVVLPITGYDPRNLLSWASLLVGVTWIVALIMSLVYQPQKYDENKKSNQNELDELSKLFEMKEKGILTQEQFEKAKEKLL